MMRLLPIPDTIARNVCGTPVNSHVPDFACNVASTSTYHTRRRQRGRAGWTLIEMLVTLAVMGTLTGIAVKTLTSMLLAERRGVEHVSQLATMSRLARTFRNDVHQSTTYEISAAEPQKPLLLLTLDANHQIHYETQPLGLLRTEHRANQPVARELWRLQPARFRCVESTGPPRLLTLVVGTPEPHPAGTKAPSAASLLKELRIDAVVGRNILLESKTNP